MIYETQSEIPWIQNMAHISSGLSDEERNALFLEAIDNLVYLEEKLLDLESEPQKTQLQRAIYSTFSRIYEQACMLGLRPGLELLQRTRAFLSYAQNQSLHLNQQDIGQLFEISEILQKILSFRYKVFTGELAPAVTLPKHLVQRHQRIHLWLQRQLEEQEFYQRCRVEGKSPKLGELLVAKGKISRQKLNQAISSNQPGQKLGEALVQSGNVPAQVVREALDLQSRFSSPVQNSHNLDAKELLELRNITGDLNASIRYLKRWLPAESEQTPQLGQLADHMQTLLQALQQRVRSFSTRSTNQVFVQLHKMVKEFSRRFDKQVELKLDLSIRSLPHELADSISEILIHLLRNAIEHGIESSEERIKLGKPDIGQLNVSAHYRDRNIVFCVEDDGQGFSWGQVESEAKRLDMLSQGASLDEESLGRLFFEQGLGIHSRHNKKGYGLELTGRLIKKLRGEVAYEKCAKGGSRFTLHLPVPPTYIHGLTIRAGSEYYLLPTSAVSAILFPNEARLERLPNGKKSLLWKNENLLPLQLLETREASRKTPVPILPNPLDPTQNSLEPVSPQVADCCYVVLENTQGRAVLQADEVLEDQMVELLFVGPSFSQNPAVDGGGQLPSGEHVWILNPNQMLKQQILLT